MVRITAWISVALLLGAACSSPEIPSAASPTAVGDQTPATDAPSTPAQTGPATTAPSAPPRTEAPAQDLDPAPDFTLRTFDGGVFQLSTQTLPVVLNFWAPW